MNMRADPFADELHELGPAPMPNGADHDPPDRRRLVPVGLGRFLAMDFPPREMVLGPWLPAGGLAMIHAPRGCGKTQLALGVSYAALVGGPFLRWRAPKPRSVLLIDGEMPAATLQERLARIALEAGQEPPDPNALRILASDLHRDGLPDLSDVEAQHHYNAALGDAE